MIANEREYQITKEEAERFANALGIADGQESDRSRDMDRLLKAALKSQLQDLREQLAEFEAHTGCGG
jgi:hypothetical protein